jgi:hypothetical protein
MHSLTPCPDRQQFSPVAIDPQWKQVPIPLRQDCPNRRMGDLGRVACEAESSVGGSVVGGGWPRKSEEIGVDWIGNRPSES